MSRINPETAGRRALPLKTNDDKTELYLIVNSYTGVFTECSN